MKNITTIKMAVIMMFAAWVCGPALAQDEGYGPGMGRGQRDGSRRGQFQSRRDEGGPGMGRFGEGDRPGRSDRPGPGRMDPERRQQARAMFGMRLQDALRELDLNAEQIEKVREILRGAAEKARDRRDESGEMRDKVEQLRRRMAEARESWDREAFEKAQAELEELTSGVRMEFQQVRDKLAEVLSDEQMKKLTRMMSPAGAFGRLLEAVKDLELNDEQSSQIRKIAAETRQAAKDAKGEPGKLRAFAQGARKVMATLNEQQKRQLHERTMTRMQHRQRMADLFEGLDLTAEQREEIRKIVEQETAGLSDEAKRPGSEEMRDVHRRINRRIVAEVLNDEQAEQFRNRLREMAGSGRGREGGPREEGRGGRMGEGRGDRGDRPGRGEGPRDGQGRGRNWDD